ncbi:TPA: DUF4238 domain-containing protein [Streptococcus suis]|nr:DUF4238 domain-containing protein [Streptococcus suis]HEM5295137.1 DUF4238 domain-containing protein [Streptococcus suis]HEM5308610.1 DUF4238 domain-containing protein [Streptococcus suis]
MFTRKQHYYPSSLLKFFANEKGIVFSYVCKSNKIVRVKPENICHRKDTYESGGVVDNILENKLSQIESQVSPIVCHILDGLNKKDLFISDLQKDILFRYVWLQYLRTDAGRVNFITHWENPKKYKPRIRPIEVHEIDDCSDKIKKFNLVFKNSDNFEKYFLSLKCPESMKLHVAISEKPLLTSDNPVIGTDNWKQIVMPIHPHICIEFQDAAFSSSENLVVVLSEEKTSFLNMAMINTANYYVISSEQFSIDQNCYIYNRFRNNSWEFPEGFFAYK